MPGDFGGAGFREHSAYAIRKQRSGVGIRNQQTASAVHMRRQQRGVCNDARTDGDRIRAVGEIDGNCFRVHFLISHPHSVRRLSMKSTICCCSCFPEPSTFMIGFPNSK